jgi:hypothetical protein
MSNVAHNLNINMYSFNDILGLFDLTYNITEENMKIAKKKVLMFHPDKSKLPPEYFLFYKKAFDILLNYYQNYNKQNQTNTPDAIDYQKIYKNTVNSPEHKVIQKSINEIKPEDFQKRFNQTFEQNMAKPTVNRNEWFAEEGPLYNIDKNVNKSGMNAELDKIKEQTKSVVKYTGVQNMTYGGGNNFYDDVDDDQYQNEYITSDPFSKLKFDDLRKVHKDQTVFAVSENDFNNVKTYKNVDEYSRARGNDNLTPLEKSKAEYIMQQQEALRQQQMAQKQHASLLNMQKYEEKNKNVLAQFLRLEHIPNKI